MDKIALIIERDGLRKENKELREYITEKHIEIETLQKQIGSMKSVVRSWDYIYIDEDMGLPSEGE